MNTNAPKPRRNTRLLGVSGAFVIGGTIGNSLERDAMPASWRGDAGLWDVASHIGNVPGTATVVGAAVLTIAALRGHLFTEVPFKKACATAGVAFAMGCSANVISETPTILDTPFMQEHFATLQPDGYDALYGGTSALLSAGLLANVMRIRRDTARSLGPTEIPRIFDGGNV